MRYKTASDDRRANGRPGTQMPTPRPIQVLSEEETDKLLETAAQRPLNTRFRDVMMIETALLTGLRPAELVGLTVWHIAPFGEVTDTLQVTKTLAKGSQPRKLPIHPDLKADFQKFLLWKEQNSEDISPSGPLFIGRKGTQHLTVRAFQLILRDISVAAIGKSVNPHRLRHTFATRALKYANLRVVQDLLGHASITNTQIYTHPSSEDLRAAVNNLQPNRGGENALSRL